MRNNRYGIGTADNDATRASIIIIAPLFSAEKKEKKNTVLSKFNSNATRFWRQIGN